MRQSLAALFIFLVTVSCAASGSGTGRIPPLSEYDTSFIGRPFKAFPLEAGSGADAIEKTGEEVRYNAIVLVSVERLLKGNLSVQAAPVPSKIDQTKDAFQKRQFLKVLTMDFDKPDEAREKPWLSIAVMNSRRTFGLAPGEEKEGRRYRIYLRSVSGQGYEMLAALPEK